MLWHKLPTALSCHLRCWYPLASHTGTSQIPDALLSIQLPVDDGSPSYKQTRLIPILQPLASMDTLNKARQKSCLTNICQRTKGFRFQKGRVRKGSIYLPCLHSSKYPWTARLGLPNSSNPSVRSDSFYYLNKTSLLLLSLSYPVS